MSISDGQRIRALESNAAWASKQNNNSFLGVQELANTGSGPTIINTQQKINDLDSGLTTAQTNITNLQTDMTTAQSDISILQSDVSTLQGFTTFKYLGTWNASTNTPTLANGVGTIGDVYRVNVAGSQNLGAGSITFAIGDKVVYNNAGVWEKWDVDDTNITLDDLSDVVAVAPVQRSILQKGAVNWESIDPNKLTVNSTLTGSNQQVPLANGVFDAVKLTNAGLVSVEAIQFSFNQEKLILINATGNSVLIKNDSATTPVNGILTGTGNDLSLGNNKTLLLLYDGNSQRWRIVGGTGGAVGYQQVPAGVVNGSNTIFGPLSFVPSNENSIIVFLDGLKVAKADWSLVGLSIQFNTAPSFGQSVDVFYLTDGTVSPPPVVSNVFKTEYRTVTGGEITAKQMTLAFTPAAPSEVMVDMTGVGPQWFPTDFTVAGNVLSWNGLGLESLLASGDRLRVAYVY